MPAVHDRSGLRPVAGAGPQGWIELQIKVTGLKGRPFGPRHSREPRQRDQNPRQLFSRKRARGPVRLVRIEEGTTQHDPPRSSGNRRPRRFGNRRRGVGQPSSATRSRKSAASIRTWDRVRPAKGAAATASEATTTADAAVAGPAARRLSMSRDIPGLVETSTNLAVASTARGRVKIVASSRSSWPRPCARSWTRFAPSGNSAAPASPSARLPGVASQHGLAALALCRSTWKQLHGTKARVTAVHAASSAGSSTGGSAAAWT